MFACWWPEIAPSDLTWTTQGHWPTLLDFISERSPAWAFTLMNNLWWCNSQSGVHFWFVQSSYLSNKQMALDLQFPACVRKCWVRFSGAECALRYRGRDSPFGLGVKLRSTSDLVWELREFILQFDPLQSSYCWLLRGVLCAVSNTAAGYCTDLLLLFLFM